MAHLIEAIYSNFTPTIAKMVGIVTVVAWSICLHSEVSVAVMEHVFAVPATVNDENIGSNVVITTNSLNPVSVHLSVGGIGMETTTTVTRYQPFSVSLPPSVRLRSTGKRNTTVKISSSDVTSVHCIENQYATGDGFLVLPTNQLGSQYFAVTWGSSQEDYPSFICLSALGMKTSVEITTKAGQVVQVVLDPYESYRFDGKMLEDLTGTFINSTYPINVISGAHTAVPSGIIDGLLEQMLPFKNYGYSFVLAPFYGRTSGYFYRIMSSNQKSIITISNFRTVDIEANEWYEGDVLDDSVIIIESNNPVFVVQYMKSRTNNDQAGDTAMMIVPSVETFVNNVTFPVVKLTINDYRLKYNIHVTVNCIYAKELMFDDVQSMFNWNRLETYNEEMCVIRGNVTTGVHSISHHHPEAKFTVAVYMFYYLTSYAYPAGFDSNLAQSEKTHPADATTEQTATDDHQIVSTNVVLTWASIGGAIFVFVIMSAVFLTWTCCKRKKKPVTNLSGYSTTLPVNHNTATIYDTQENHLDKNYEDATEPTYNEPYADINRDTSALPHVNHVYINNI